MGQVWLVVGARAAGEPGDELSLHDKERYAGRYRGEYRSGRNKLPRRLPHTAQRLQSGGQRRDGVRLHQDDDQK